MDQLFEGGFKLRKTLRWKWSLWYLGGIAILMGMTLSISQPIEAQIATTTATLSGTVTDPTGAIIPNALVTLASTETGTTRSFTSDSAGRYVFANCCPQPIR